MWVLLNLDYSSSKLMAAYILISADIRKMFSEVYLFGFKQKLDLDLIVFTNQTSFAKK